MTVPRTPSFSYLDISPGLRPRERKNQTLGFPLFAGHFVYAALYVVC
jgi:hypothetical protein